MGGKRNSSKVFVGSKHNFHYVYFVSTFSVFTGGDGRYVQEKLYSVLKITA